MSEEFLFYSEELLTHYQCGKCNKWFAVGDSELDPDFCPFCGTNFSVKSPAKGAKE